MTELITDKVKQSLKAADGLYHRLVLLVGEAGSGKTAVLRRLVDDLCVPIINVNLELSASMLELTLKQRSIRLPKLLDQIVETGNPVVLLDNLEILFDKSLEQDPLRLLERISRNRSVIATWSGSIKDNRLVYAKADHQEYRWYDLADILIVGMDGMATIDAAI